MFGLSVRPFVRSSGQTLLPLLCILILYFNRILIHYLYFYCILVCTGLVGASRKSPCLVIIIIIIITTVSHERLEQSG